MWTEFNTLPAVERVLPPPASSRVSQPSHGRNSSDDVYVDGQKINIVSIGNALSEIEACLTTWRGFALFTANLDHLTKMRREESFRTLYNQATYVTSDGWPVAFLARRSNPFMQRTPGADLVIPACEIAARNDIPVYLFGSTPEALEASARRLVRDMPKLRIVGQEAPPFGFDPYSPIAKAAAERIAASGARLCFVALGAPKQEQFAILARQACPNTGFLCIGASLDFLAGKQIRAPGILQRCGLEWAWRLALSPRRLGPRYLSCALLFAELLLTSSADRLRPVSNSIR